jgi:hypothetical protein
MIVELDVSTVTVRLAIVLICLLPAHGCGGSDVDVETPTEERQTVSAGDEVVELMRSPAEPLIYDKPVNLAKPAPPDSIAHPADTTRAARDTTR